MSQKKRKYQDNYLDFGFTYLFQDGLKIPVCPVQLHEIIFKQYHETCSAKTTFSKCSCKYNKQKPVLF